MKVEASPVSSLRVNQIGAEVERATMYWGKMFESLVFHVSNNLLGYGDQFNYGKTVRG